MIMTTVILLMWPPVSALQNPPVSNTEKHPMPIDFSSISAQALGQLESLVSQWLPGGTRSGSEWKALNPTRADAHAGSFSVNLTTGAWADFATDDNGGDPISLYAYLHGGIKQGDAAKALAEELGISIGGNGNGGKPGGAKPGQKKTKIEWHAIVPVPSNAPPPLVRHYKHGIPSVTWVYRAGDGQVMGYTCRFDGEDGAKEIVPLTYCQGASGAREWRWQSFDAPRPIFGLDQLTKYPDKAVLVVEGEKCATAAGNLLRGMIVVSWIGGSPAVGKIDWTPLRGRKLILWPDADRKCDKHGEILPPWEQPGIHAMHGIYLALREYCPDILMVNPPESKPDTWDVADAINDDGWNQKQVTEFIRSCLVNPSQTLPPEPEEPQEREPEPEPCRPEPASLDETSFLRNGTIRFLGHDHRVYYYLPRRSRQIVALTARDHTSTSLLSMARSDFWESWFSCKKGVSWDSAINALFDLSEKKGIYSPDTLRGCGAWYDEGRVVLHFGDYLSVDGVRHEIHEFDSKYIYEQHRRAEISNAAPLQNTEAIKLLELCNLLAFEKPVYCRMLAGWIVLAPICGALDWRPHIWITGSSGTGKSFVADKIIKPCIGNFSLNVMGSTSEPGIRRALYQNAFPVTFDESEQEYGSRDMKGIIQLMRQSSSESDAYILKGGHGEKNSVMFKIRSCFCMISVHLSLNLAADISRISVLTLGKHEPSIRQELWEEIQCRIGTLINPEWCAALRSRSVALIPQIRENTKIFGSTVAAALGNQRTGDQYGALLAGAYSLSSSKVISPRDAEKWVDEQDWSEQREVISETDERNCLDALIQFTVTVAEGGLRIERTIGQLIGMAARINEEDSSEGEVKEAQNQKDASATLLRYGMRVFEKNLLVSASHRGTKKLLERTAWAEGWHRILMRIDSVREVQLARFGPGARTKAAAIPLGKILNPQE